MTTKITVKRIDTQTVRVTLVADVQISGDLIPKTYCESTVKAAKPGTPVVAQTSGTVQHELLTVEQAAEILRVSLDRIYYLIRTEQLRSIKIGKLRRISRLWVTEFIEQLEVGGH